MNSSRSALIHSRHPFGSAFDPKIAVGFSFVRQRRYYELDRRSHRCRNCSGEIWTIGTQPWSGFVFKRMCFAELDVNFETLIAVECVGWHIGAIRSGFGGTLSIPALESSSRRRNMVPAHSSCILDFDATHFSRSLEISHHLANLYSRMSLLVPIGY